MFRRRDGEPGQLGGGTITIDDNENSAVPARSTALPLYLQISETMIREIAAGRLVDGQRLPPERDFAKQYGTTVTTLRKALAELEAKGLLNRVQGSGNYVRTPPTIDSIYAMFRLERVAGGGLPTAQILDVRELEKQGRVPSFGVSDRGTRIRRLRFLDKEAMAIEEVWLDGAAGRVDPKTLSDSLYLYYKKQLNLTIARAEDRMTVAPVPDWRGELADRLQAYVPQVGDPVGYIERFSWPGGVTGHDGDAVEFSRTWFDPARARYVQRFK